MAHCPLGWPALGGIRGMRVTGREAAHHVGGTRLWARLWLFQKTLAVGDGGQAGQWEAGIVAWWALGAVLQGHPCVQPPTPSWAWGSLGGGAVLGSLTL